MPLTGWVAHAATTGFAPIRWPFGQDLPFVPESAAVEHVAATLHTQVAGLLMISIALHVAGALKHALIDRDGTLRRMLPGRRAASVPDPRAGHGVAPPLVAAAVYGAALLFGASMGFYAPPVATASGSLEEVASGWTVEEGALGIAITQLGSRVEGSFGEWTAEIEFDEAVRPDGSHGDVEVRVALASISLGTVSAQAQGPDFLDAGARPVAVVTGTIWPGPDGADAEAYVLRGAIALRGVESAIGLPFRLTGDGDRARAEGTLTLDRRDFFIGAAYPDEGSLGFAVEVSFDLTAVRTAP